MTTSVKMKLTAFAHCEQGMFSKLQCGEIELYVLEPPWLDNRANESCIPAGIYDCVRIPKSGDDDEWWVMGVEGRTDVLIHPGNTLEDTDGCLLPGMYLGCVDERWSVKDSKLAMFTINQICDGVDSFRLYIDRSIINQSYNG